MTLMTKLDNQFLEVSIVLLALNVVGQGASVDCLPVPGHFSLGGGRGLLGAGGERGKEYSLVGV